MMKLSRIGAVLFLAWGALHVVGGLSIMAAALESPALGYAIYGGPSVEYPAVTGAALAYLAFGFAWVGLLVAVIAIRSNWRNDRNGFFMNTALVGFTDLGLVLFFLAPGHLPWSQGAIGLGLFALAFGFSATAQLGGDAPA